MKFVSQSVIAAALCCALGLPAAAQMGPPSTLTAAEFSSAPAGQPATVALRVESRKRNALRGELLDRTTGSHYRATGHRVTLYLGGDTPVVMGSLDDVTLNSIVYASTVKTARDRADVKKLTVVTGSVIVDPART